VVCPFLSGHVVSGTGGQVRVALSMGRDGKSASPEWTRYGWADTYDQHSGSFKGSESDSKP